MTRKQADFELKFPVIRTIDSILGSYTNVDEICTDVISCGAAM